MLLRYISLSNYFQKYSLTILLSLRSRSTCLTFLIKEVKKNLNAEKRNVTQLSNKRDNVITSYQIAAKEYVSAKAKQDSLSHKPNSPAYKNAVKQTEKYGKKKDELLNDYQVLQYYHLFKE